jgi:hypothetical protein
MRHGSGDDSKEEKEPELAEEPAEAVDEDEDEEVGKDMQVTVVYPGKGFVESVRSNHHVLISQEDHLPLVPRLGVRRDRHLRLHDRRPLTQKSAPQNRSSLK